MRYNTSVPPHPSFVLLHSVNWTELKHTHTHTHARARPLTLNSIPSICGETQFCSIPYVFLFLFC
jgi:hypothetical protein